MESTPPCYPAAEWRCTLPYDVATDSIGIGFSMANGSIVRLKIDSANAQKLIDTIQVSLFHSDKSSGIPSNTVLPMEGQYVAPPAKSSAACSGRP